MEASPRGPTPYPPRDLTPYSPRRLTPYSTQGFIPYPPRGLTPYSYQGPTPYFTPRPHPLFTPRPQPLSFVVGVERGRASGGRGKEGATFHALFLTDKVTLMSIENGISVFHIPSY